MLQNTSLRCAHCMSSARRIQTDPQSVAVVRVMSDLSVADPSGSSWVLVVVSHDLRLAEAGDRICPGAERLRLSGGRYSQKQVTVSDILYSMEWSHDFNCSYDELRPDFAKFTLISH